MTAAAQAVVDRDEIIQAFVKWSQDTGRPAWNAQQRELVKAALSELPILSTQQFDVWWIGNHHRFMGGMREMERRPAREAARVFLADLALGKVDVEP